MEDRLGQGWGEREVGVSGFPHVPPGPTVPRTDLGLSLQSSPPPNSRRECAAATLRPAHLQRAGVGGSRGCCSRALRAHPTLPSPSRTSHGRLGPTPSGPIPRQHHFLHQEGRGRDAACTRQVFPKCHRLAAVQPSAYLLQQPNAGYCGAWGLRSLRRFARGSRTPSRAPRAAWAVPHQAQGTLPLLPVPYLLPLRLRFWARLWRARLQGHREQAARSERARADLTLQLGARVRGGGSREAFVTVSGPAPSPCRLLPARWRPAGWPAWHLSAAVFLTAPAWALWLSLLCIFLGISLPAGEGQYLLRDLLAIPSSSLGTCLLLSSAREIHPSPLQDPRTKFKGVQKTSVVKIIAF